MNATRITTSLRIFPALSRSYFAYRLSYFLSPSTLFQVTILQVGFDIPWLSFFGSPSAPFSGMPAAYTQRAISVRPQNLVIQILGFDNELARLEQYFVGSFLPRGGLVVLPKSLHILISFWPGCLPLFCITDFGCLSIPSAPAAAFVTLLYFSITQFIELHTILSFHSIIVHLDTIRHYDQPTLVSIHNKRHAVDIDGKCSGV